MADALCRDLREQGLLEGEIATTDDQPVGGATETATITAGGETISVPAFDEAGEQPLDSVSGQVRALVGEETWRSFERRRVRYSKRVYGEAP